MSELRLYDTAARSLRPFEPVTPGHAGIYVCGATPQSSPHLGHLRSSVAFDVLRRWLLRSGYAVTFVRNVTDIDDKILAKAVEAGVPWWQLAARHEREFLRAYDVLGCLPASIDPRATGHIPEMISLMHRLIYAGRAYPAGGDVYFDVRAFPEYGALSGQRPDAMESADDVQGASTKRDPLDFALWKAAKPGEPFWETPWGPGRPGWHLECSAMATKYLGDTFDIHGGGLDLKFPHHENEVAQSRGAGDGFANYWLHNGWLTTAGEKQSKSMGNFAAFTEVVRRFRPVDVRYYLVASHYRSHQEYSQEALTEAGTAYARIEGFVRRAAEVTGAAGSPSADPASAELPAAFSAALDDDLGVPAAVAVLHDVVRDGNKLLADGASPALSATLGSVRAMLDVLGLDPLAEPWAAAGETSDVLATLDVLVPLLLQQRQAARERKDFAASDALRDALTEAGIAVEDTAQGQRWTLAGGGA